MVANLDNRGFSPVADVDLSRIGQDLEPVFLSLSDRFVEWLGKVGRVPFIDALVELAVSAQIEL